MKSALKYILTAFFCLLLVGCKSNNSDAILPLPTLSVPDSMLNKDLRITAPAIWNDFKKEENSITLEITLVTSKQIITTPDFNTEIYLYDDTVKEWKKIENLGNYKTPPDEIILHQGDIKIMPLSPDLSKTPDSQNRVLILVSGNVVENGSKTDKVIGAYIILHLEP
jgi:uncharacterized protein YcfL